MAEQARPDLVLGLGNVLCGDDGVGIFALERLRSRYATSDALELVDGGTLGLMLLPTLESADSVWILDAVAADAAPGSLVVLDGRDVEPALRERLSPHQIGVADLMDAMHWRDTFPARLRVLGLVPQGIELGLGLSPPLERALDTLVEAVASDLMQAGHRLARRPEVSDEAMDHGGARAARALGL
jgi:hydrogenase maturation protease